MKTIYDKSINFSLLFVAMSFVVAMFFSSNQLAFSQNTNPVDTAIIVSLENPLRNGTDGTFRFDIYLTRSSEI